MLNTFPSLLTYSFFAPTLLRVVAACMFAYIAYLHIQRREEIGKTNFILIGAMGSWIAWVALALEGGIALGLLLGYFTQIAALLGLLVSFKHFIWKKMYPRVFPLYHREYVLIAMICISLLLTGAGALAFDLRL